MCESKNSYCRINQRPPPGLKEVSSVRPLAAQGKILSVVRCGQPPDLRIQRM